MRNPYTILKAAGGAILLLVAGLLSAFDFYSSITSLNGPQAFLACLGTGLILVALALPGRRS